ncbi:hypothetical protein L596_017164 [Steinernema carpocapsae]|uniref:ShKT domain-containing protein n=1 Tax=Steinernema carpocapsae TaxID=34508 RepID=A0A4U5N0T1_STECR|nr:hypothetical protein L596_017164 [Steinernema carpocapsae]
MSNNLVVFFCCFGIFAVVCGSAAFSSTAAPGGGTTGAPKPKICSDPTTGNVTHIATACEDSDMPLYCGLVNQTTSDEDRDERCINDATFAKYCPSTCGICCKLPNYSCKNSLGDEKCAYYLDYCKAALYKQTLTNSCPATCGFCGATGTGANNCKDTLDYCDKMEPYCNSKGYEAYRTACPVTCNSCGSVGSSGNTGNEGSKVSTCKDTVKNCFTMRSKCTHPQYTYFTTVYCKRTCGFCR